MTEAEWLTSTDPRAMFALVERQWSLRRARLFSCAIGHRFCRIWESAAAENEYYRRVKPAVDAGCGAILRAAEDLPDEADFEAIEKLMPRLQEMDDVPMLLYNQVRQAIHGNAFMWIEPSLGREREEDSRFVADLLRCVSAGPIGPPVTDPRWLTETAVSLATGIYAERTFDRMPILADALEEAGCDHADMLAHCRGDAPHVRGCWVVDLVLGKV